MARSFPASAPFCSPCSQAAEPNSKPRVAGRGCGEGQAIGHMDLGPLAVQLRLGRIARVAEAGGVTQGGTEHGRNEHGRPFSVPVPSGARGRVGVGSGRPCPTERPERPAPAAARGRRRVIVAGREPESGDVRYALSPVPARESPAGEVLRGMRQPLQRGQPYHAVRRGSEGRGRKPQASADRGAGAADGDGGDPARHLQLADRSPARDGRRGRERRTILRRDRCLDLAPGRRVSPARRGTWDAAYGNPDRRDRRGRPLDP